MWWDQFPLRDDWIHLKAWSERLLGKQENNSVYFGKDNQTLFAQFTPPSDLAQRVSYVNQLAENVSVPVYFSLIPDKSYVWADRLPDNAPLVDNGSTLQNAQALCSGPGKLDRPVPGTPGGQCVLPHGPPLVHFRRLSGLHSFDDRY